MSTEAKTIIIVGIVSVLILVGGAWLYQKNAPKDTITVDLKLLVRDDSMRQGPADAKVTVVEFADYQCPACEYIHPFFEELKSTYKDRVSFVFRDFPLNIHQHALKAAQLSYIANEQGKYYEMQNKLFTNQKEWEAMSDPTDLFVKYATDIGMDVKDLRAKLGTDIYKDRINRDIKDGLDLGVNSTPTFFVGNVVIRTANADAVRQAIEAHLENASPVSTATSSTASTTR